MPQKNEVVPQITLEDKCFRINRDTPLYHKQDTANPALIRYNKHQIIPLHYLGLKKLNSNMYNF